MCGAKFWFCCQLAVPPQESPFPSLGFSVRQTLPDRALTWLGEKAPVEMKPDMDGASWVMEARTEAGQKRGHLGLSERDPLAADGLSLVEADTSLGRSALGGEWRPGSAEGRDHMAPCLS